MTEPLIISLSLPKSGTTALARALRKAGRSVIDWRIRKRQTDDPALAGRFIAEVMYEDYFDSGDPLARLTNYDAISEMNAVNGQVSMWPQTDSGLLAAILTHHPDTKFLLSMRKPEAVAKSIMGWNTLGEVRMPRADVPGLPKPYGGNVDQLSRWVAGHYDFCHRFFQGAPNFLAYDLDDPDVKAQIADFVGFELPWWGKANVNIRPNTRAQAIANNEAQPDG